MTPALRRLSRDIPAMIGLLIVIAVIAVAVAGPLIVPYPQDATTPRIMSRMKPPSAMFWFGTDNLGRDILSRIILGTRGALQVGLTVVGVSMIIGVPLGLFAGYRDGWLSEIIMGVTDIFLALPQLILALALAQLMGASLRARHVGAGDGS